ncbi:MAG: DUF2559 family protein [Gallionella sp.]|nr:DUF2559 family protein [Gallionella sp.]
MPASLNQVLKVADLDELKALGSYFDLKKNTEKQLGFKLNIRGWDSLFQSIKRLRSVVPKNKDQFFRICQCYSFNDAKHKIFELLELKIAAKNKKQLEAKLENLVRCFNALHFDPYKRFEETKLKNFKNSSKLEGIEICLSSESSSLESILAKYKR